MNLGPKRVADPTPLDKGTRMLNVTGFQDETNSVGSHTGSLKRIHYTGYDTEMINDRDQAFEKCDTFS